MRAACLFTLAAVLASTTARAGNTDAMTAETLFTEALALAKKGDYVDACPKFAQSYRLEPATGALLNWAECEAQLGKTATAWLLYRDAAARAGGERKGERAKEARLRAAELEPKLCRLRIEAPAGLQVTRDDVAVDANALGTATPVDPGEHVVSARREDGAKAWTETFTIEKGDGCATRTITVPASWPGDRVVRVAPVVLPPPPPKPKEAPGLGTRRWAAIGVAGLGVVALGVGTGFGLDALGKKSDSDALCVAAGCSPEGSGLIDRGQRSADVATGLFVGGAVALGSAIVLWLTAPRH